MHPGASALSWSVCSRAGAAWRASTSGRARFASAPAAAASAAAAARPPDTGDTPPPARSPTTRILHAAVLGAPNAGKSSLTNALVGAPVAAASPKTNTTAVPLLGAFSAGPAQVALLDLPGLVAGGAAGAGGATARRVRGAWAHAAEAGLALLVVDAERQARRPDPRVVALAGRVGAAIGRGSDGGSGDAPLSPSSSPFPPTLLILNKVDLIPGREREAALAHVAADLVAVAVAAARGAGEVEEGGREAPPAPAAADPWASLGGGNRPIAPPLPPPGAPLGPFAGVFALSSLKGGPGLDALRARLLASAAPGPWAVPPSPDGAPTDRGWPGVAAQAVSAELFTALRGDVPYTLDVRPIGWATLADGSVRGEVEVLVPRRAVRGILVGTGGGRIRAVGIAARAAVKEAMAAAAAAAAAEADAASAAEMVDGGGEGGGDRPPPRRRPVAAPPTDFHLIVTVRVDPSGGRRR